MNIYNQVALVEGPDGRHYIAEWHPSYGFTENEGIGWWLGPFEKFGLFDDRGCPKGPLPSLKGYKILALPPKR